MYEVLRILSAVRERNAIATRRQWLAIRIDSKTSRFAHCTAIPVHPDSQCFLVPSSSDALYM